MSDADPPSFRIAPPAFLNEGAPALVLAAIPQARAVGGCVRDYLARVPISDVDIAVPLAPDVVVRLLTAAEIKVFETGISHGTVTAVHEGSPVEVTSLRRDVVTDGRHAEVVWTSDWREDASRRDFTMNAMSMDRHGAVWDYFGGLEDLRAGLVRFIGDPEQRLQEDYLRVLRYFRFFARYHLHGPDAGVLRTIERAIPGLAKVSAERVWSELKKIVPAGGACQALRCMAASQVLACILPEASQVEVFCHLTQLPAPPDALLRLASLLEPGQPTTALAASLRVSSAEAHRLRQLVEAPALDVGVDRLALTRLLAVHGHALVSDWAWLAEARGVPGDWDAFRARAAALPRPEFPLRGQDAVDLGIPAGPALGRLLAGVRDWWLAEGCQPDREACLKRLAEAFARPGA